MIAVRIGPDWRLVAVASPAYLELHPTPKHPQGPCCVMTASTCVRPGRAGCMPGSSPKAARIFRVRVDGQLTFNNSYAMIDATLNGYGLAYVPEDIVSGHIKPADLVVVLDDWSPSFDGYFIYYPSKRQNAPAFKVIVDALRHRDLR